VERYSGGRASEENVGQREGDIFGEVRCGEVSTVRTSGLLPGRPGRDGLSFEVYGEATTIGEAASGGGVEGVPGEVPPAIGDRGNELAIETGSENRSPASEAVGTGASRGGVESIGLEHQAGGSGEKGPNFHRISTTNVLEMGENDLPF